MIGDLTLWPVLAVSAALGAAVAAGCALLFDRLLKGRLQTPGGDNVTSVGSRRELVAELCTAAEEAADGGTAVGLLLVDIDAFSDVNRLYGRATGDAVLAEVADRIGLRVGADDFVARVDADEFAVVCRGGSLAELQAMRRNLEAFVSSADSAPVTLSIGVATPQPDDRSGLDLLIRARQSLRERRAERPQRAIDDALSVLIDGERI